MMIQTHIDIGVRNCNVVNFIYKFNNQN